MLSLTLVTDNARPGASQKTSAEIHALACCMRCAMRHLCVTQGSDAMSQPKIEALISWTRKLRRGESLFRAAERFDHLYVVRSGSLKMLVSYRNGRHQITGWRLAGEIIGLDGIEKDVHTMSAVALEDSLICVIPYEKLKRLSREVGALQDQIYRVLSEQFNSKAQLMVLGPLTADERVAAFLLDLSDRNGQRGYSQAEFRLRMSREDVGNYLGITLETVSRALSKFKRLGLVHVQGKLIRILDMEGLRAFWSDSRAVQT